MSGAGFTSDMLGSIKNNHAAIRKSRKTPLTEIYGTKANEVIRQPPTAEEHQRWLEELDRKDKANEKRRILIFISVMLCLFFQYLLFVFS